MHVTVTGASGFIGGALCALLRDRGHAVRALVRAPLPALEGSNGIEQAIVGDLEHFTDWPQALGDAEAVVHLAAHAHGRGSPSSLRRLNVDAPLAAARAAAARGTHFVFMSSVKVHGEESTAPLRESAPVAPRDAYGRSKADAEAALRRVPGLRLTVLRPPLVYGPRVKANFLGLMRALDRGIPLPLASVANRRSLVYAGNLADAVVACLERKESAGRTYLIADGRSLSTPELCRALGAALRRPARLFAFPPSWLPLKALASSLEVDDGAIRRELGWRPPFDMEQGFEAAARWYQGR